METAEKAREAARVEEPNAWCAVLTEQNGQAGPTRTREKKVVFGNHDQGRAGPGKKRRRRTARTINLALSDAQPKPKPKLQLTRAS